MSEDYAPPQEPLAILHADHEIVVVDKPAGLLSVPGRGAHLADCLLARVQAAFPEALLVHRLDRDTSGVMVFALTRPAQRNLGLQFERRKVKKTYVARVAGPLAEDLDAFAGLLERHLTDEEDLVVPVLLRHKGAGLG